ncbi:hypothetical protein VC279_06325 [Xanthomonas sp. WHRI 10064A]|uniref:hypothetical protein n=1 Tax=unclassified Xanthomonas TaxID=2643310 RepID=UPI002B228E1E|nr:MULTISPECIES: hypothetical protein [unclassified Xanthomonas]MEA9585928.1 hypothetical protein [Xanthomonas sp. WHRI 10064B]MEA9614355.1 hypothetical protein [Xanthomonas sp. WHRI 10064A]
MFSKNEARSSPLCKVYYRPIEAAIRWSGLHRHEAMILDVLGERQTPTLHDFPRWPLLRLNAERIYDGILNDELAYGYDGLTARGTRAGNGTEDDIDQTRLTVRHTALREWMQRCYPGQRPRFLFTASERAAHPIITLETGQAMLAEQAATHALLRQCQQDARSLQARYDALLSRQATGPISPSASALSERAETTYLNIIGALLDLLLGKAPSGKPYSSFRTQEAVISALMAHNDGLMGLTERTLQGKFARAKRQINARQPPPAQDRMCGRENRIGGVQRD